jgi:hypothetical protein
LIFQRAALKSPRIALLVCDPFIVRGATPLFLGALGPAEPALFTTVWGLIVVVSPILLLMNLSVLGVAPPCSNCMSVLRLLLNSDLFGVDGDGIYIIPLFFLGNFLG